MSVKRHLPLHTFLAFALLFGQLATVWHAVGHIHPPVVSEHAAHGSPWLEEGFHTVHDEQHAHAGEHAHLTPFEQTPSAASESELCLLYHVHGAQYAATPAAPEQPELGISDLPGTEWAATANWLHRSYAYLIRGPPNQS